jgi:signal transduction histidine kinase
VIGNLLRNAIRHTRPGGMVGVFVSAAGANVQLEVRDTGEGMSEEELARIWEPFYQGDAHRAADSAGLGLPLVKTLTERMGGTVCASSQPGEGSCFTLRFPAI